MSNCGAELMDVNLSPQDPMRDLFGGVSLTDLYLPLLETFRGWAVLGLGGSKLALRSISVQDEEL